MFKLFLLILIATVFEIPFEIDDPIFFRVMMILNTGTADVI